MKTQHVGYDISEGRELLGRPHARNDLIILGLGYTYIYIYISISLFLSLSLFLFGGSVFFHLFHPRDPQQPKLSMK